MAAAKPEADERQLVEAAQHDPRRFAELYERNFARVYAYVARRVPDRAAAEDVTSEVFHRALESLPQFEWRGVPFAAWLYRIAANALRDRWQQQARERGNPAAEPATEPDFDEIEQRAMLFRLVNGLPAEQRRVVVARFAEQKSIREIAKEIGKTEGAVKQLQFRALEKLRAQMGQENG